MGLVESGTVANCLFVEDDEIRSKTFANQSAIAEAKCLRRQRSHLANCVLKRDHLQLSHVAAKHTRVVAITARMRHAFVHLSHAAV